VSCIDTDCSTDVTLMARPRLELGTPRFPEGPNNPFEEADLQDFYW
jgi:hypothetical protein